MIRLNLVVEGRSEERFVKDLLAGHLAGFNVSASAHSVTTSRSKGRVHRGGMRSYAQPQKDIAIWTKEDRNPDARFSTMFDLYRLPSDFPRYAEAMRSQDPFQKVLILEKALAENVQDQRFIPYIQLHEFEALLFADVSKLASAYPDKRAEITRLAQEAGAAVSPEHIDDGEESAPSKRIGREIPRYLHEKLAVGPQVATSIGLRVLRAKCAHFNEWVAKLEALGQSAFGNAS